MPASGPRPGTLTSSWVPQALWPCLLQQALPEASSCHSRGWYEAGILDPAAQGGAFGEANS